MLTAFTSACAPAASRSFSTRSKSIPADLATAPTGCWRALARTRLPARIVRPDVAAAAADAPTAPLTVATHRRAAAPAAVTDVLRLLSTMRLLRGDDKNPFRDPNDLAVVPQ